MVFPDASTPLSRRTLLRGAASACALAAAGCALPPDTYAPPGPPRLRLLGEKILPHRMRFKGTTVGGLSAIDHDPATGLWVTLSDDKSEIDPARFYTFQAAIGEGRLDIELQDVVILREEDGQPFPPRKSGGEVVDPEGIRLLPGGAGVLWTSEGDERVNQSPGVRQARLDGSFVRAFAVPAMLQFSRPGVGPRDNLSFEGIALTPDARTAWVSMEAPLLQDGPVPGVGHAGGPCRFTAFDVASGRALRQLAYQPDPVPHPPRPRGGFTDNGVSDILMLDANRMLVLERSYSMGVGTSIRIYEIDTRAASDTLAQTRLRAGEYRPAAKRFVADFAQLGLSRTDNTEGLCWGPRLANGSRTLVVVSDDNFSARQVTQFAAFEYLEQSNG
jgi:hypothetical protein